MKCSEIKIGDVIMPPAREVRLWMRRHATEYGLPDSALYLTVARVDEGVADKTGPWLLIECNHSERWNANRPKPSPFTFKARPSTEWIVIKS